MKERIKELRKALGLTQQEFADRLGIKRGSIGNYELGRNDPVDSVISLICDRFHVNETWLRNGDGEMFMELSRADELQRLIDASLSEESGEFKRRIATAIMRLTPEQLRICTDWIKETFNLVDAPAADPEPERELTIDEKLDAYRKELEAQEEVRRLEASPTGNEKEA
jgi:transcriptional regulator with XRE-family HTH domain